MQAIIPTTPLIHVMNHAIGTSSNAQAGELLSSGSFDEKLAALLTGDTLQNEDVMSNTTSLPPEQAMLLHTMGQMPADEANDLTLLAMFMAMLTMDDDELQALLSEHPELNSMLIAAGPLLSPIDGHQQHHIAEGSVRNVLEQHVSHETVQLYTNRDDFTAMRHTIVQLMGQLQSTGDVQKMLAQTEHKHTLPDRLLAALQLTAVQHGSTSNIDMGGNRQGQQAAQPIQPIVINDFVQQMIARLTQDNSRLPERNMLAMLTMTSSVEDNTVDQARIQTMLDRFLTMAMTEKSLPQQTALATELSDAERPNTSMTTTFIHDLIRSVSMEQRPAAPVVSINAQQFSEQITPFLIKHVQLAKSEGISEARIALVPEHLGHVNIHIMMKGGQMVAQFMAETLHGKHVLEGQLSQLRTVLQEQGIQVNKLEVVQGEPSSMFQQPQGQHPAKQSMQSNKHNKMNLHALSNEYAHDVDLDGRPVSNVYGGSFEAVV